MNTSSEIIEREKDLKFAVLVVMPALIILLIVASVWTLTAL